MDNLLEALSISGIAIVMVFVILTLLMLALNLSAVIFGQKSQQQAPRKQTGLPKQASPAAPAATKAAVGGPENEHIPAIIAALEAAGISTSGGRMHIEKVSRRSE